MSNRDEVARKKWLLIAFLAICAICVLAQSPGKKRMPLYAVEAEWGWHDGITVSMKPCDPPAPKDSTIACAERDKSYYFTCPREAIGVLPPEAVNYINTYTVGQDGTHPVVYCIIPGDAND